MISVIYGAKGSGKTKRIIDAANGSIDATKGNIVYITDQPKHSPMIKPAIRFVDSSEYNICSADSLLGFIKGILASNGDITLVYIDGLARMACMQLEAMEEVYIGLERLAEKDKVDFIVTASTDVLPKFLKKYSNR